MMKPDPSDIARRCWLGLLCLSKNSLKNWSSSSSAAPFSTFWVVDTLTTPGNSLSARPAKLSGAGRAWAAPAAVRAARTASSASQRSSVGNRGSTPARAAARLENALEGRIKGFLLGDRQPARSSRRQPIECHERCGAPRPAFKPDRRQQTDRIGHPAGRERQLFREGEPSAADQPYQRDAAR